MSYTPIVGPRSLRRVVPLLAALLAAAGCSAVASVPPTGGPASSDVSAAPENQRTMVTVPDPSSGKPFSAPLSSRPVVGSTVPSPSAPSTRSESSTSTSAPTRVPTTTTTTPAPAPTTGLTITGADERHAAQQVARMSVREQAAVVLMPAASQVAAEREPVRYGGVILMGADGVVDGTGGGTPAEVRSYVTGLQATRPATWGPLLVGVDQEYGDVARLVHGFTDFPGASELAGSGRDDAPALTERVATAAAQEMRAVGVSIDFAPDADVLPAEGPSAIGDRSYGTDPGTVARFVAAAVRGYQRGGVAATLKHFPGIGGFSSDTHEVLPTIQKSCAAWNTTSRVPFAAGIEAGAALVMTGHVLFPAAGVSEEPASLSPAAIDEVLRGKGSGGCTGLGFGGISVSDSFEMAPVADAFSPGEAAWRALAAGQDLILLPASPGKAVTGIVAAVSSGELRADRLSAAATKVLTLQSATSHVVVPSLSVVGSAEHRALAEAARG